MTPLVLVAALLLFSPLAAEAQNTTKKKLKVAVPPFTFESIVIHSGAEGEFKPDRRVVVSGGDEWSLEAPGLRDRVDARV
jgi:hypothetical protein